MRRHLSALAVVVFALAGSLRAESDPPASELPAGYRADGADVMHNLEFTVGRGGYVQVTGAIRSIGKKNLGIVVVTASVVDEETGEVLATKTFSAGILSATRYYYIKSATWKFPALACTVCHGTGVVYETASSVSTVRDANGIYPELRWTRKVTCPHCTGTGWEYETHGLRIVLTRVR